MPSTDTPPSPRPCVHCGTPFPPTATESEFCCSGCRYVYALIHEQGLGQFYNLRDRTTRPVGSSVFNPHDTAWVQGLQRGAEQSLPDGATASATLALHGVSCVGCVWLIEELFRRHPGALQARAAPADGTLRLTWRSRQCDLPAFVAELEKFGYQASPPRTGPAPRESSRLTARLGVCAALAMNAMLFSLPHYLGMEPGTRLAGLFSWVAFALATASLLTGGTYFLTRSLRALRHGLLHLDTPIALGLLLGYAGSLAAWRLGHPGFIYFDFVAIFTFLMLGGRWIQERTLEAHRNPAAAKAVPDTVERIEDGTPRPVPLDRLQPGDSVRLPPGRVLPANALVSGRAVEVSLEWINGEPEPRLVQPGYAVPAGATLLGTRPADFTLLQSWSDSLLKKLTDEPPDDPALRRPRGLETLIRTYLAVVFLFAAAGFLAWGLFAHQWITALQVMISLLVVSCPCAIGVALPLADDRAAAALARRGVFVRAHDLMPRLRTVRRIILDKTGTLTLDELRLENPQALAALAPEDRAVLHRLVEGSLHPVSRSLRSVLWQQDPRTPSPPDGWTVREDTGFGLEASLGHSRWRLGRPAWAGAPAASPASCAFSRDGKTLAEFTFSEQVRDDAPGEIRRLRAMGHDVFLLSGDRADKVAAMARALGIPEENARGAETPESKAAWVRALDRRDTLMVGDGANDSLAFDAAWVRATPAVEKGWLGGKSDFYFLGRNLSGIRLALLTARTHGRAARNVLAFAILYNALAAALCLAALMSPLVAAILMPLSSIATVAIVAHAFRRPCPK